jgi:hypothetical protein
MLPFNKKKAIIRAMRGENEYVQWNPSEPNNISTHLMMHRGKEVFPSVFPKEKGQSSHDPKDWIDLPNREDAYSEAKKRGEVVKFVTKKRAEKMAHGAWKQGQDRKEAMQHYREEKRKK